MKKIFKCPILRKAWTASVIFIILFQHAYILVLKKSCMAQVAVCKTVFTFLTHYFDLK